LPPGDGGGGRPLVSPVLSRLQRAGGSQNGSGSGNLALILPPISGGGGGGGGGEAAAAARRPSPLCIPRNKLYTGTGEAVPPRQVKDSQTSLSPSPGPLTAFFAKDYSMSNTGDAGTLQQQAPGALRSAKSGGVPLPPSPSPSPSPQQSLKGAKPPSSAADKYMHLLHGNHTGNNVSNNNGASRNRLMCSEPGDCAGQGVGATRAYRPVAMPPSHPGGSTSTPKSATPMATPRASAAERMKLGPASSFYLKIWFDFIKYAI
jgi:hypothetical protein